MDSVDSLLKYTKLSNYNNKQALKYYTRIQIILVALQWLYLKLNLNYTVYTHDWNNLTMHYLIVHVRIFKFQTKFNTNVKYNTEEFVKHYKFY